MSCTSPLWRLPYPNGTGKVTAYLQKPEPYLDKKTGEWVEPQLIACGQCRSCRVHHAREWANRCVMEQATSNRDQSWFMTLTYDDDHLPAGRDILPTLMPEDMTKFFHDLRQYYKRNHDIDGIRYYYAGEYGDTTGRPHYHALIYNLPIYDLRLYNINYNHDDLFNSDTLSKIWHRGHVVIGQLTWESACYTARYTMKKLTGLASENYYDLGILPEFQRQSNRPGIGAEFLEKYADKIYTDDNIIMPSNGKKLLSFKPPKAFDRKVRDRILLSETDLDLVEKFWSAKFNRQNAADATLKAQKSILGLDDVQRFKMIDETLERNFKSYGRNNFTE